MTSKFDLCIATRKPWPKAWPQLTWESYVLTPGDPNHAVDLSLHHSRIMDALTEIHPSLSLLELAKLHEKLVPFAGALDLSLPELFTFYKMRYSESLKVSMNLLLQTPLSFQEWAEEKNLGAQDLAPLKIWKSLAPVSNQNELPEALSEILAKISEWNASKSVGVKLLEVYTDLHFMGKAPLLSSCEGLGNQAEHWLQELLRLRNPETEERDCEKARQLRQLPWPAHTQAKWMRTGDSETIEVSIKSNGFSDLSRKLQMLKAVTDKIGQESLK